MFLHASHKKGSSSHVFARLSYKGQFVPCFLLAFHMKGGLSCGFAAFC